MKLNVSRAVAVLTLLLAGAIITDAQRDYRDQSLDLVRFLATKPWAGRGHNRWDRSPRFDMELVDRYGDKDRWGIKPNMMVSRDDEGSGNELGEDIKFEGNEDLAGEFPKEPWNLADNSPKYLAGSAKRSAVATALNGRRRRQPAPALGKAVTPYVGVGVLNDVGSFFDSLRDNLESLASLSPQQRATLFADTPNVVRAPSSGGGGGGGGTGMRRIHALRPLRPTGNIRTYNRRSFVETDGVYPGANHHDPGLLWTGLGRRRR